MGLMDHYGANARTVNPIFARSVEDILTPRSQQAIERLPFRMPTTNHEIARFFNYSGRRNAAGIRYVTGTPIDVHKIDEGRFGSHDRRRPPNPDYVLIERIPYPVGETDANGAGMTWGWTPLAYMLYHDRFTRDSALYSQIANSASIDLLPAQRDLWTRFLRQGALLPGLEKTYMLRVLRVLVMTDPPADLLPELMFTSTIWAEDYPLASQIAEAATDFQFRWNCGEWFHPRDRHQTRDALFTLLGV